MAEEASDDLNNKVIILALCIASLLLTVVVLLIAIITYYYFRRLSGEEKSPCISSCCLDTRSEQDPIIWPDNKRLDQVEPRLQWGRGDTSNKQQFSFQRYKDEEPDQSADYPFEDEPDELDLNVRNLDDRGPIQFAPPIVPPYSEVNNPFFQPQAEIEHDAGESTPDQD